MIGFILGCIFGIIGFIYVFTRKNVSLIDQENPLWYWWNGEEYPEKNIIGLIILIHICISTMVGLIGSLLGFCWVFTIPTLCIIYIIKIIRDRRVKNLKKK